MHARHEPILYEVLIDGVNICCDGLSQVVEPRHWCCEDALLSFDKDTYLVFANKPEGISIEVIYHSILSLSDETDEDPVQDPLPFEEVNKVVERCTEGVTYESANVLHEPDNVGIVKIGCHSRQTFFEAAGKSEMFGGAAGEERDENATPVLLPCETPELYRRDQ